jgi:hydrogenase maturation factor HypE
MRVIGYIEHPTLKISIFKMDQRISVKFENTRYEQTYKLGEDERLASVEAVQKLVDAAMLEAVMRQFEQMHQAYISALSRAFMEKNEPVFEEII